MLGGFLDNPALFRASPFRAFRSLYIGFPSAFSFVLLGALPPDAQTSFTTGVLSLGAAPCALRSLFWGAVQIKVHTEIYVRRGVFCHSAIKAAERDHESCHGVGVVCF